MLIEKAECGKYKMMMKYSNESLPAIPGWVGQRQPELNQHFLTRPHLMFGQKVKFEFQSTMILLFFCLRYKYSKSFWFQVKHNGREMIMQRGQTGVVIFGNTSRQFEKFSSGLGRINM